jgi:hypothetical protein
LPRRCTRWVQKPERGQRLSQGPFPPGRCREAGARSPSWPAQGSSGCVRRERRRRRPALSPVSSAVIGSMAATRYAKTSMPSLRKHATRLVAKAVASSREARLDGRTSTEGGPATPKIGHRGSRGRTPHATETTALQSIHRLAKTGKTPRPSSRSRRAGPSGCAGAGARGVVPLGRCPRIALRAAPGGSPRHGATQPTPPDRIML